MANVFLNREPRDVETAIMLEKAIVHPIGNAVAYTDGKQVFVNTDDNLEKILPAYDHNMLKWLLWHERYHVELRHHNRFFKYLSEIKEAEAEDKFHLTKSEVNIIMDILVHDSLSKMFPELVETAEKNLAQMRDRNSLEYTFTTYTLEEMLDEYAKFKQSEEEDKEDDKKDDGMGDAPGDETKEDETKDGKSKKKGDDRKPTEDGGSTGEDIKERTAPEESDEASPDTTPSKPARHDEADWSKLDNIDDKEFIDECDSRRIMNKVNELKRKRIQLAQITETLNGLATGKRIRTYAKPSSIKVGGGVLLKGSRPTKAKLYLCFDTSGSMGSELKLFQDIIQKSVPQAMSTPVSWFSGYSKSSRTTSALKVYKDTTSKVTASYYCGDLYKATFKEMLDIGATSGYGDDGDRTIELCWLAEQKGYTPIGVTDGGGSLSWSKSKLKELKRTVFVGPNKNWLNRVKEINPKLQTIDVSAYDED